MDGWDCGFVGSWFALGFVWVSFPRATSEGLSLCRLLAGAEMRDPRAECNSTPAVNVDNKNPTLTALGKMYYSVYIHAGIYQAHPHEPESDGVGRSADGGVASLASERPFGRAVASAPPRSAGSAGGGLGSASVGSVGAAVASASPRSARTC